MIPPPPLWNFFQKFISFLGPPVLHNQEPRLWILKLSGGPRAWALSSNKDENNCPPRGYQHLCKVVIVMMMMMMIVTILKRVRNGQKNQRYPKGVLIGVLQVQRGLPQFKHRALLRDSRCHRSSRLSHSLLCICCKRRAILAGKVSQWPAR